MNPLNRLPAMILTVLVAVLPGPALAYIGPGAGLGAIAVAFALLFGFLLLIVGLVWYPLKRRFKRRKADTAQGDEGRDLE